jgi:hypothetical protein
MQAPGAQLGRRGTSPNAKKQVTARHWLSFLVMSAPPPVLRKHYKQRAAVSAFYMGGPIDLGCDGEYLIMRTQSCVSILFFPLTFPHKVHLLPPHAEVMSCFYLWSTLPRLLFLFRATTIPLLQFVSLHAVMRLVHQHPAVRFIFHHFYVFMFSCSTQVVIASRSSFVRICASVDGSELRKFRVVGGVVQVRAHFSIHIFAEYCRSNCIVVGSLNGWFTYISSPCLRLLPWMVCAAS